MMASSTFALIFLTFCFRVIFGSAGFFNENSVVRVGNGKSLFSPADYLLNILTVIENFEIKKQIQGVVNEKCAIQLDWFVENLNSTDDGFWALRMLDASSKIPSGILKLNLGEWMGSFDECLEIKSRKRGLKGNYCLGTLYVDIEDPFELVHRSLARKAKLFAEKKKNFQNAYPAASYPSIGICIPDGCHADDLQSVVKTLNFSIPFPFECQNVDEANPPLTTRAWSVIGFFLVIIGVMTASTMHDLYCRKFNTEPYHILMNSFSLYTNGQKLIRTRKNSAELSCLNGIRVLSMIWVVVGHTFSVTATGPVVNALDVLEYLDTTRSMIFVSAINSVDTFLMVTGLLVVYAYMKTQQKGISFNPIIFYFHRYIRLTPPLLAVMLVSMSLLQYIGSGPHWSFIVNYFQGFCEKNWWSSLIYFQNYINVEQWCVGQTWYLNIDWQLYLLSPLFLLTLTWRPIVGVSLLGLALIVFIVIPFYVTWANELPALVTNLYGDLTSYQHLYYLRTHTRASPWFVGALFGYFISTLKFDQTKNIKFNKIVMLGVWSIVLLMIPICIFLGHDDLRSQEYHKYSSAFYNSLLRPTWAACIGWIVFACTTGYGGFINTFLSLPLFQVLNRFTYSIYLLHVTMLYMIIYASKTPVHFSFFHVAYSFWGITMLVFVLSIFWVLAFESPVIAIERYFLERYYSRKMEEIEKQGKEPQCMD